MNHQQHYFIFMSVYNLKKATPAEKEEYALTVIQAFYDEPSVPENLRARVRPILNKHLLDRAARNGGH